MEEANPRVKYIIHDNEGFACVIIDQCRYLAKVQLFLNC